MIIAILLTLVVLAFLTGFSNKIRKLNAQYNIAINFLLAMIATFFGAFIAIDLSNQAEANNEKKKVINYIESLNLDLESKIQNSEDIYNTLNESADFYIKQKSKVDVGVKRYNHNPFQIPKLLFNGIENDILLRNISSDGIQEINLCVEKIESLNQVLNHTESDLQRNTVLMFYLPILKNEMKVAQQIIKAESSRINGIISTNELRKINNRIKSNHKKGYLLTGKEDEIRKKFAILAIDLEVPANY